MPRRRIDIAPLAYLYGAALLLLLPLRWILALLLAAAVHEIGHILAVRLCGGQVQSVAVHSGGAEIISSPLNPVQSILCSLAGPMAGLVMLGFFRWLPCTAMCALVQSVYNLLPLRPLDGGRALEKALELLLGQSRAMALQGYLETAVRAALFFLVFWLDWGFAALLVGAVLIGKWIFGKIPCKKELQRLQCQ